jgi:hypothetical protein
MSLWTDSLWTDGLWAEGLWSTGDAAPPPPPPPPSAQVAAGGPDEEDARTIGRNQARYSDDELFELAIALITAGVLEPCP